MRRANQKVRAKRVKTRVPFHHEMRPSKLGAKGGKVSMTGKDRGSPLTKWKPTKK